MRLKEVTQFFIIPPADKRTIIVQSKEQFEDFMLRQFPGHIFHLTDISHNFEEDEFTVIPLINYIDGEGNSRMCEKPEQVLIDMIVTSCRKFDFKKQISNLQ